MEKVIWLIVCLVCALIMGGFAFLAYKSKQPVSFINGERVEAYEIRNIKAYNMANAGMWAACCAIFVIIALFGLMSLKVAIVMLLLACMPGMLLLIATYNIIYNKYSIK